MIDGKITSVEGTDHNVDIKCQHEHYRNTPKVCKLNHKTEKKLKETLRKIQQKYSETGHHYCFISYLIMDFHQVSLCIKFNVEELTYRTETFIEYSVKQFKIL